MLPLRPNFWSTLLAKYGESTMLVLTLVRKLLFFFWTPIGLMLILVTGMAVDMTDLESTAINPQ